jgi:Fe-S cluster biogenesis protein NfuA
VENPLLTAIRDKLDARVRPILQAHGGDLTLTAVGDGVVSLRFEGACVGCPLRPVTLAVTVEPALRTVDGVEAVEVEGVQVPICVTQRIAATLAGSSRFGDGRGRELRCVRQ